ncbi:MAG: alpha-1,2-fucosyltransferase [Candidatus Planktophila sp.]|nr:alpha-1,2-fucosyltransferase [Candidatus Planktophila sp.]
MKYSFFPNRKYVIVEVEGGLGNTIFQYAAGKYLANRINAEVLISLKHIGNAKTNHGFYLANIFPEIKFHDNISQNQFWLFKYILKNSDRLLNRLARKNQQINGFCTKFYKIYRSPKIGYDSNLGAMKNPLTIRGYFQTWKYAQTLIDEDAFVPQLNSPSIWYREMSEYAREAQPVIMHVRRGDYQALEDIYGLLSSTYYLNALNAIPKELRNNPIWVFSDDISVAKQILENDLPISTLWINPPQNSNPAESLMLMSLGHAHIIANSSFSYWAAQLSLTSQFIIAPRKWFKSMEDPNDLINPSWHFVDSDWN